SRERAKSGNQQHEQDQPSGLRQTKRKLGAIAPGQFQKRIVQEGQAKGGRQNGQDGGQAACDSPQIEEWSSDEAFGGANQSCHRDLFALRQGLHAYRIENGGQHDNRDSGSDQNQANVGKTQQGLEPLDPLAVQLDMVDVLPGVPDTRKTSGTAGEIGPG